MLFPDSSISIEDRIAWERDVVDGAAVPVVLTARMGNPLSSLNNGASATAATYAWFVPDSLPVESELATISVNANAGGSMQLLLAVPNAITGGFDVTTIATKTVVSGVNTFSVALAELPATTIPAGSLVGYFSAVTIKLRQDATDLGTRYRSCGYIRPSGTGNPTGTNHTAWTYSYIDELQLAWTATATRGGRTSMLKESFVGSGLPPYAIHGGTAWTYGSGIATPGAVGIANRLSFYPFSCISKQTLAVQFQFDDASGHVFIAKEIGGLTGASIDRGTIVSVDVATNTLKTYAHYNTAATLPTVSLSTPITGFTLATGKSYLFEIIKDVKTITAKITDIAAGLSFSVSNVAEADSYGWANGRPCIGTLAGTAHFEDVNWYTDDTTPKTLVYGDSITEGSGGTTAQSAYAGQLQAVSSNGLRFTGDGGAVAESGVRYLQHDLNLFMPKYAVFYFGANNATSDLLRDNYLVDMPQFIAECEAMGVVPIIMTPTPDNTAGKQARLTAMRDAVVANGVEMIRSDLALGAPDGVTYNAGLMADSTHPNQSGHDALYARCLADQSDIV